MMLTAVTLRNAPGRPLLVLGPSLGTSVETLWGRCVARLRGDWHVVGWDLPGHGRSAPAHGGFGVPGLAKSVLELVDRIRPGATIRYAGDSIGGAVGLQLLLDAPRRVEAAVVLCTGAKIGEAAGWRQRAETVRAEGTQAVVAGSIQRWFGPGFPEREPASSRNCSARCAPRIRKATPWCARPWRLSTFAIGLARSPRPCSPSPAPRTSPHRPRGSR